MATERKSNKDLIEEFLTYEEVVDRSPWTLKALDHTLKLFFEEVDKQATDVDCPDVLHFFMFLKNRNGRGGKTLHPETIRKHINNLASFFNYLEMEHYIQRSPVVRFRMKYMRPYLKSHQGRMSNTRQLISLEEMRKLLQHSIDLRDRAIMLTLAKTGVRAGEFLAIEVDDIDWKDWSIRLKENNKRSNSTVFFDNETANVLKRWLKIREFYVSNGETTMFVTRYGKRISHHTLGYIVKRHAKLVDLHDDESHDLQKRFTPHCFRHWFTTTLRKAGMPREYIQELRGDTRTETMDIYYHISPDELRESYLRYMPFIGV